MFEIIYSLFLVSGVVKFFFNALFKITLPVDITLALAVVLIILYLPLFFSNMVSSGKVYFCKSSLPLIVILVIFYFWMIFTLIFTKSTGYSYEKIFLSTSNLFAFVLPLLYIKFRPKRFLKYHVFISTFLSLLFIYNYPKLLQYSVLFEEDKVFIRGYLTIGYISGLTAAILIFLDVEMKKPLKLAIILFNVWALMISGGRGPMIFLVLVLVLKVGVTILKSRKISIRLNPKKIAAAAVVVGVIVFSTYTVLDKYSFSMERSLQRLTQLLDIGSDASVSTRLSYIDFSIDKIFEDAGNFLFGSGIGSFGILYSGIDGREYPHNIFLEIQFELGLVGIAAIIMFLIFYLKKIRFRGPLIYPFLYIFLNSLKSGSFTDLRIMFGFFSVFLLYDVVMKRKQFPGRELR